MVDSINPLTTGTGKYDITFAELDANKDGVVNKTDYDLLKGYITDDDETNDINVSANELDEIFETVLSGEVDALEDCPDCKAPEEPDKTDGGEKTTKSADDVAKAATDLLAKYPVGEGAGGDAYSLDNPEMAAFKNAVDGGAVKALSDEGFTASQIVDIIAKAYPSIGIANNDQGGYSCPYGHGEAAAVYTKFIEELKGITAPDKTALKEKVKKLNDDITANNLQLNILKGSIEKMQAEVEEAVATALKQSEEIAEAQKEEAEKAVKEELAKYTESNGEMTYAKFQENLTTRLDTVETDGGLKMSKVVLDIMNAESKMATLKGYVEKFGTLVNANKTIADEIKKTQEEIDKPDDPSQGCEPQRCDPIGFKADGVQYDFFVDKDKNGDITNEKEFLGAEDGWKEMAALDADNDGKVEAEEMQDLMVVVTKEDGTQEVKKASEVFGADDSIDLNSYSEVNKDFENGNTLLGTFSVNMNGQNIDGYNTMDTLDWLDENYNFTDEDAGIGRFAQGNEKYLDVTDYAKEQEAFVAKVEELDQKMDNAWSKIGITRADVAKTIIDGSMKAADAKAIEIENMFKKTKANPPEEETPTDTPPADETPNPDDPEKKEPEV